MDVKVIQKNLQQQNLKYIFPADIQRQQFGDLIKQKINKGYTVEKIV